MIGLAIRIFLVIILVISAVGTIGTFLTQGSEAKNLSAKQLTIARVSAIVVTLLMVLATWYFW